MKHIATLSLALAAATLAGGVLAQQATSEAIGMPGQGRSEPEHAGAIHAGRDHAGADRNRDGVIDRAEAAAHPRLLAKFDQLDRNHDGRLDASERPRHRHRGAMAGEDGRGGHHRGGDHAFGGHGAHGMARLDANGDGRIARDELATNPRLVEQFAQIDANRDGYLVRSEVRAWRERMHARRMAERATRFDAMFKAADLDHDGKLSKVEASEAMPRMQQAFAWMDENRDGFLSRQELQPRHR